MRAGFRRLHASGGPVEDAVLDDLLGLRIAEAEPREPLADLLLAYGNHRIDQGDLPYGILRQLFHRLPPGGDGPLVDLGCGYGRIAFYGAMVVPDFRFWGIELIHQRVAEARRVRDQLGLANLDFEQGDAASAPWPRSDRFCLMNPDLPCHAPALIRRLEEVGRRRSIVVVSISSTNDLLSAEPWLEEIGPPPESRLDLRLFASKK